MIDGVKFYLMTFFEPPHFPFWEAVVFFNLCMQILIIFRLAELKKGIDGLLHHLKLYYINIKEDEEEE